MNDDQSNTAPLEISNALSSDGSMHALHIEPGILTPSMRLLNEKHHFDTMAARQTCLDQDPLKGDS
jgi:hypothetical protein